ncbi:MAG: hypothetical protein KDC38_00455 [Planctomycetes bacterium]|nr:hypothetical protein [Planctomycetota bacterium]
MTTSARRFSPACGVPSLLMSVAAALAATFGSSLGAVDAPKKGLLAVIGIVGEIDLPNGRFELESDKLPRKRARVELEKSTQILRVDIARLSTLKGRTIWLLAKRNDEKKRFERVVTIASGDFSPPALTKKHSAKKGYGWHQGALEEEDGEWRVGGLAVDLDEKRWVATFETRKLDTLAKKQRVWVQGQYTEPEKGSDAPDIVGARKLVLIEADIAEKSLVLLLPVGFDDLTGKSILGI